MAARIPSSRRASASLVWLGLTTVLLATPQLEAQDTGATRSRLAALGFPVPTSSGSPDGTIAGTRNESPIPQTRIHQDRAVQPAAFTEDSGGLNWRRPSTPATSSPTARVGTRVALAGPQNRVLGSRANDLDPINDPFGDQQIRGTVRRQEVTPSSPAPQANVSRPLPTATPSAGPTTIWGPSSRSTSARRMAQDEGMTADEMDCEKFYERLENDKITDLQLSVSPTFRPGNEEQMDQDLADARSGAPVVEWTNRQGQLLAVGRMYDYVNGRVYIQDENGQSVTLDHNNLSAGSFARVAEFWRIPGECILPDRGNAERDWIAQTYTWKASALCHKPLYFEDVQLERYGHSAGPLVQPFKSGAHFFLNIAALPYNVGVYTPNECRYALGYYRPGNAAPFRGYALPLSARGALTGSAAYVGLPFILP